MSKKNEFDNILDACLERLISGEAIEKCLADFPDYAAELEPLLRTVLEARKAAAVQPRAEFRQRARYEFQTAIRDMETEKGPGFFAWFPRWATVVSVLVIILLAATGTVAASTGSLPDEPLYQVKLATEAVRLAFTPSALGKAELYAKFADDRVEEIIRMADEGKSEQIEKAADRMNDQLLAMSELVEPWRGGEDAQLQTATFEAAEAAPVPAPTPAPAPAPMPAPEPEPTPTPEPEPEVLQIPAETPAPLIEIPPEAVTEAPAPTEPAVRAQRGNLEKAADRVPAEEKGKSDDRAQLRVDVSENALENIQKLRESLDKAPEALKPALQRALEIAEKSYEKALRNLD